MVVLGMQGVRGRQDKEDKARLGKNGFRHQTRCLVWEKGAVGKWAEERKQIGNWWWGMRVGGGGKM